MALCNLNSTRSARRAACCVQTKRNSAPNGGDVDDGARLRRKESTSPVCASAQTTNRCATVRNLCSSPRRIDFRSRFENKMAAARAHSHKALLLARSLARSHRAQLMWPSFESAPKANWPIRHQMACGKIPKQAKLRVCVTLVGQPAGHKRENKLYSISDTAHRGPLWAAL